MWPLLALRAIELVSLSDVPVYVSVDVVRRYHDETETMTKSDRPKTTKDRKQVRDAIAELKRKLEDEGYEIKVEIDPSLYDQ